jgi:Tfp pilus assembly protein PilX
MSKQRWLLRAENEDGMALVLAVVTMTVLTIMVVSMLSFTSASSRDASVKNSRQGAYALAEGGVNQALAQLASHYYVSDGSAFNSDGTPVNNSTVFAASWFTGTTSQKSSTDPAACTATSTCMAWSASYTSASAGIKQGTVALTGTGTVPNPTGAHPLTQRVTTKVDVIQPSQLVKTPSFWKEIYAGAPPSSNCDFSLGQGVTITAPMYVAGNLCLTSSALIAGSGVDLKVLGWAWLKESSKIGSSGGSPARINSAQIAGACSTASGNTPPSMTPVCTVNATVGKVWDNTPTSSHTATSPTQDPLPTILWSWVQDRQSNSLPAPSCTNGRSLNEANFALTPTASYTCTTAVGSIQYTYNPSGVSTLVTSGDVYFPGNITIDTRNALAQYSGIGSFFVGGAITTANNAFLCVKIANGDCDFANATNSGSPGYWDSTQSVLLLQAHGAIGGTNFHFQGGMYSETSISFGGGQGTTQGPLICPGTITVGQQLNGSFPSFPLIEAGSLGTPPPPYKLTAPYGGAY